MKTKAKNFYGRVMSLISMKDGDDGDQSLNDFFDLSEGVDDNSAGGNDDSDQNSRSSDEEAQDQDQDQDQMDDDQEGDSDSDDDSDSNDVDDDGDNDDSDGDDTQVDPRDKQIEQLLEVVNKLTKEKEVEEDTIEEEETDPFKTDAFNNLAKVMNWDDDEKSAMKDFLALRTAHNNKTILSQTEKTIPQIVNSTMTAKEKSKAIRKSFYDEHPALNDVKDYAGMVAKTVAAEHTAQGKPIVVANVFKEAAARVYKNLNITPQKKDDNKSGDKPARGKKPAFASNKGARKKASKQTADQKMIGAIMDLDF